jgi:hypothetical protein
MSPVSMTVTNASLTFFTPMQMAEKMSVDMRGGAEGSTDEGSKNRADGTADSGGRILSAEEWPAEDSSAMESSAVGYHRRGRRRV